MSRLIVYRNCFTGDVSGGDMHMSGLLGWMLDTRATFEPLLVLPKNDGQEKVYPELRRIKTAAYKDTALRQPLASMYIARALKAAQRINALLRDDDRLVASSHFLPDVLPVFAAHVPAAQKTVYIHHIIQDMSRPPGLNTTLANMQEKMCFALIRRRFGKIIVVNQAVAERLREMGFRKQKILLSSNFVHPLTKPTPYGRKDITLAFCGRMVQQKGVDDFVAVCRGLAKTFKNFRAVMIGVGPELERLRGEVKKEKLPVELAGYVDDQTKFDLLSKSCLLVMPSVEEGWGIAIAEALCVGTPVVAYDLPVYGPVFGGNIHTVPFKDVAALAAMSASLLGEYERQPATYQTEQKQIVDFTTKFRIDAVARKELEFMEKK